MNKMPVFSAEASLYKSSGHYVRGGSLSGPFVERVAATEIYQPPIVWTQDFILPSCYQPCSDGCRRIIWFGCSAQCFARTNNKEWYDHCVSECVNRNERESADYLARCDADCRTQCRLPFRIRRVLVPGTGPLPFI